MRQERIGPAASGDRAGVQLGGEPGSYSKKLTELQVNRTVLRVPDAHLLADCGSGPSVLIDRANGEAVVWVGNSHLTYTCDRSQAVIWEAARGYPNTAKQFLNGNSVGVDRYAALLQERIQTAAATELARRDRMRAAKQAERGGR